VLADENGDIGYVLIGTYPIRKNKTLFAGCNINDGRNSNNDWEGFI
jgi:acyl-homoserine lactone acylase PvdQ